MNAVELRQLNYFVATAEEQSFTRAAERLWVAQPGLSTQIRRLESELGVRLFERRPRGVDLTDAGELFLERARKAVAAAELARSTGDDLRAGLVATIRLGIVTGAGWPFAGTLLARFGRDHPDVELTVVESYAGTLLRDLHDGRLDAVLVPSTSPRARSPGCPWVRPRGSCWPARSTGWPPRPGRSRRMRSTAKRWSSPATGTAPPTTGPLSRPLRSWD